MQSLDTVLARGGDVLPGEVPGGGPGEDEGLYDGQEDLKKTAEKPDVKCSYRVTERSCRPGLKGCV